MNTAQSRRTLPEVGGLVLTSRSKRIGVIFVSPSSNANTGRALGGCFHRCILALFSAFISFRPGSLCLFPLALLEVAGGTARVQ